MEVFIAFTRDGPIRDLGLTMEAWDIEGLEPVAIQVKPNKFQLHRRVTAESISVGDYILCDIGFAPVEENFAQLAEKELAEHADAGMVLAGNGKHIAICRRGVITHWPIPRTDDYRVEHIHAYNLVGYQAHQCQTVHYRPIAECLPS